MAAPQLGHLHCSILSPFHQLQFELSIQYDITLPYSTPSGEIFTVAFWNVNRIALIISVGILLLVAHPIADCISVLLPGDGQISRLSKLGIELALVTRHPVPLPGMVSATRTKLKPCQLYAIRLSFRTVQYRFLCILCNSTRKTSL